MSEIVKKSAEIIGKSWIKAVAISHGVPGEVVDIVAARVAPFFANPNDVSAKKSYDEIKEEILLELASKSEQYKGGRPPSNDDVDQALLRFFSNYKRAGGHQKRRLLFNALHNAFK